MSTYGKHDGQSVVGGRRDLRRNTIRVLAEEEDLATFREFLRQRRCSPLGVPRVLRRNLRQGHLHGVLDLLVRILEVLDERAVVQPLKTCGSVRRSRQIHSRDRPFRGRTWSRTSTSPVRTPERFEYMYPIWSALIFQKPSPFCE
jgi:hypothetical protein